jgi:predicted secreted hydrolase
LLAIAASGGVGAATSPGAPAAEPPDPDAPRTYPGKPHEYPVLAPGRPLVFPRDFGAHPDFRTEWWYVTGWLEGNRGFQVTFFRVRTRHPDANPSRFAPKELLFAHAALMDPANGHPLHGQRAARSGSPGVACSDHDTDVRIGEWQLVRGGDDRYRAVIREERFALDLFLEPPGTPGSPLREPWLQGDEGYSRKGPRPNQASRYYSRPQLRVSGRVDGRATTGVAWFDHEWSTTVLDEDAAGWDWTGINFDDGSAVVAFRIRRRGDDPEPLWRYCALRDPGGQARILEPVRLEALRRWQSPRTGARYPVAMRLLLPGRSLRLEPLFDDQELDGRGSTGTIYWEGAVRVHEEDGRRSGLGYLELTGYHAPIRL